MEPEHSRLLRDHNLVHHFLEDVLEVDYTAAPTIVKDIVLSELFLAHLPKRERTLLSPKYRDRKYVKDEDRWKLRKEIISELCTLPRLENDDEIVLGAGGALPNAPVKHEGRAYIIIGLPGSGKSTIANAIADEEGALIIDSDYAKRKLPEFDGMGGASLVHEESGAIIYGFSEANDHKVKSMLEKVVEKKQNLVVCRIGAESGPLLDLVNFLIGYNYEVHLTLVSLEKKEAAIRSLHRFQKTRRYVPLGYTFYHIGNDPTLTYYSMKEKKRHLFKSFGAISTNVKLNELPRCIDLVGNNPAGRYPTDNNYLLN